MSRETPRRQELNLKPNEFSALAYRAKAGGAILGILASLLLTAIVLSVSRWSAIISAKVKRFRVALTMWLERFRRIPIPWGSIPRSYTGPLTSASSFAFRESKNRPVHAVVKFRGEVDEPNLRELLRPWVHSLRVRGKRPSPSGRAESLGLAVLRGLAAPRLLDPDRTPEVNCGNCRAKFRPWYGANDSGVQTIHVNRCGLCEGDPLMKLMYEDCGLQLVARVTNRGIRKTITQLR
jgi:hypothetical protein